MTSEAASQTSPKGFSLADVFKLFQIPISKVSSSDLLKALGKFLPVHFQKGISTSGVSGCPYHIGDFAQGGVIIYLTHDGMHGLVAAIEDAKDAATTTFKWGPNPSTTSAGKNSSLPFATPNIPYGQYYGGYVNQQSIQKIVDWEIDFSAFKVAADYSITVNGVTYNDWWLPSSTELSLMYALRGVIKQVSEDNGGSGMTADTYWSSLKFSNERAWYSLFSKGKLMDNPKENTYAVRCIRAF